jgi:hypothetical protein
MSDNGSTMVELHAGRARITFMVANPWEMISRHSTPMMKLNTRLNPPGVMICKNPSTAKIPMIQIPRDSSEVLGFMIMRQARFGLPR